MTRASTVTLGPFKVDAQGLLSPATAASFPGFAVRWRDRIVHARMHQDETGNAHQGTLEIAARLGRVPSTAEPAAFSAKRGGALAILRLMPGLMPAGWNLRLTADHAVVVEALAPLVLPVSAIALVTQMAAFLLDLGPYLDALDEEGIAAGGGTANT